MVPLAASGPGLGTAVQRNARFCVFPLFPSTWCHAFTHCPRSCFCPVGEIPQDPSTSHGDTSCLQLCHHRSARPPTAGSPGAEQQAPARGQGPRPCTPPATPPPASHDVRAPETSLSPACLPQVCRGAGLKWSPNLPDTCPLNACECLRRLPLGCSGEPARPVPQSRVAPLPAPRWTALTVSPVCLWADTGRLPSLLSPDGSSVAPRFRRRASGDTLPFHVTFSPISCPRVFPLRPRLLTSGSSCGCRLVSYAVSHCPTPPRPGSALSSPMGHVLQV